VTGAGALSDADGSRALPCTRKPFEKGLTENFYQLRAEKRGKICLLFV